ncbi:hypothetical protein MKX01_017985 [Papaver californicum]|nr:hypothetical protein MKX01_017985 [Papaver californicum]
MQIEARVGVVVDGGNTSSGGGGGAKRTFSSGHGGGAAAAAAAAASAIDGGARNKFLHQKQPQQQHQHQQNQHISTVSQLLAGGVAGVVGKTCTTPLARLTILFQVQGMHTNVANLNKANIWREASRIVRGEGFRAFWKGNFVTIVHRLPYSSISLYCKIMLQITS